ncbi:MAG: hypothetical protein AB8I08_40475 [Sandaracinaceae bacterium]
MSLVDLAVLYLIVGAGCAAVVYRRTGRPASAALALPLWPIWAPVALVDDAPRRGSAVGRVARIEEQLTQAVQACRGSAWSILLPDDAVRRLRAEINLVVQRIDELDEVLEGPGFDLTSAERRVSELSRSGGSRRALETAVLHRNNVARIQAMRDRSERALEELGEVVGALRSQLVLARYAGSSPEGVGGIVTELWAHVEGLADVMNIDMPPPAETPADTPAPHP